LHLADAEERGADNGDDDGRDERKGSFVCRRTIGPLVGAEGVEDADDGAADSETDEEADARA
jgi:hypothetical protein